MPITHLIGEAVRSKEARIRRVGIGTVSLNDQHSIRNIYNGYRINCQRITFRIGIIRQQTWAIQHLAFIDRSHIIDDIRRVIYERDAY